MAVAVAVVVVVAVAVAVAVAVKVARGGYATTAASATMPEVRAANVGAAAGVVPLQRRSAQVVALELAAGAEWRA